MLDIKLLDRITQEPGAPGHEYRIRTLLEKEIAPYVDETYIDAMGNLVAIKQSPTQKKTLVAAHMDEISFVVTHIDDDGFIKFHTLGGFDPKTLTAQRVIIHGTKDIIGVMGTRPIHIMTPEEKAKKTKIEDFYIDTGLPAEEVKAIVELGNPITREREFIEMGDMVNSKSLDNRICCYQLVQTLKDLKDTELSTDLYAVFTVQEEVGLRGATAVASGINPDMVINLDVTLACDVPGSAPHERITDLGKGAAIKVLDGASICDYRMVRFMKEVAKENNIKYQLEVLPKGGTDTAGLQRHANGGSIAGGISMPCRYLHQVIEMASKSDLQDSIDLLKACLIKIGDYDWSHS